MSRRSRSTTPLLRSNLLHSEYLSDYAALPSIRSPCSWTAAASGTGAASGLRTRTAGARRADGPLSPRRGGSSTRRGQRSRQGSPRTSSPNSRRASRGRCALCRGSRRRSRPTRRRRAPHTPASPFMMSFVGRRGVVATIQKLIWLVIIIVLLPPPPAACRARSR